MNFCLCRPLLISTSFAAIPAYAKDAQPEVSIAYAQEKPCLATAVSAELDTVVVSSDKTHIFFDEEYISYLDGTAAPGTPVMFMLSARPGR